jgi:3-oxoadipate enol-lactonase
MPDLIVRGARLYYEFLGPADGQTVALLNGIAMSVGHWKAIADLMAAEGYRVLLHDMRGQFLSEKPEGPYSFSGHAADLAALLDALGIDKAHIVGTSYGAEMGLYFAREYRRLTASLVVIAGAANYDTVLGRTIESWKAAALMDSRVFYRTILPWNYSASWLAQNSELLAKRESELASLPADYFKAFAALCDAFLALDIAERLGDISVPTLALAAGEDLLKPPRYSRFIADKIPGAEYEEIPGSGHAVVLEQAQETARRILAFLKRH